MYFFKYSPFNIIKTKPGLIKTLPYVKQKNTLSCSLPLLDLHRNYSQNTILNRNYSYNIDKDKENKEIKDNNNNNNNRKKDIVEWLTSSSASLTQHEIHLIEERGGENAFNIFPNWSIEYMCEHLGLPWGIASATRHHLKYLERNKRYMDTSIPYRYPYDGDFRVDNTALVIIDMQKDFCSKGGYVDKMGYDVDIMRQPIQPIKKVLSLCREKGIHIIHTREGHRRDLSDLPANKRWRSVRIGAAIGSPGPLGNILVRGEEGWNIIEEVEPIKGETIIDKSGKGSFYATDLEHILQQRNIRNLLLTGVTTDVCVFTTMREANDRGYECLLIEDCCASTKKSNHNATIDMIHMQGGVFGATITSNNIIESIKDIC